MCGSSTCGEEQRSGCGVGGIAARRGRSRWHTLKAGAGLGLAPLSSSTKGQSEALLCKAPPLHSGTL